MSKKSSSICSSVEGEKLKFNTRQFQPHSPYHHKILGKMVYPFKLGIHGYVEIETPLDDPNKDAIYETSFIDEGDYIQGGTVDGWSTKPIKKPTVINATGTHKAVEGSLKGHCYAHVQSSHRDHMQSEDIQARHPEIVLVINPKYKEI